jgi:hypothetical protein
MNIRIALLVIALVMGCVGWYGLSQKPEAGKVCSQSGKLAAASDGSIVACSDGVAWKQAH